MRGGGQCTVIIFFILQPFIFEDVFTIIAENSKKYRDNFLKSLCSRMFFIQEKVEGGAAALGIDNVGGIFLVLLIGLVFSCLTAIIEFSWSRRKSKAKNVSFG